MAKKKPAAKKKPVARKKPAVKRWNRLNVSIDDIDRLVEGRQDSDTSKAFDDYFSRVKVGTVGAARLVTAADAIEDEDLLLGMARMGFTEALYSHTMRRRIMSAVMDAAGPVACAQAAMTLSSPNEDCPNAWMLAEFCDAIAVNGKCLSDEDAFPGRPENFVLMTDRSGPVTTKVLVDPPDVSSVIAVGLGLQSVKAGEKAVLDILKEEMAGAAKIPVSVSGDTEVWMDVDEAKAASRRARSCELRDRPRQLRDSFSAFGSGFDVGSSVEDN